MTTQAPEVIYVNKTLITCDGGQGGHPRVWLQIPQDQDWVECPYCDAQYILQADAQSE